LPERGYGEFQRACEKIEAAFANGVLTVTLPKIAKAAPKKIEVKAAA
jgi:HSP20 family protein